MNQLHLYKGRGPLWTLTPNNRLGKATSPTQDDADLKGYTLSRCVLPSDIPNR
jgi:hypothetical protein